MVGNLTKKNKKCQMPGGQPGGGSIGTLGIDSAACRRTSIYSASLRLLPKLETFYENDKN